jgi:hypothetical protein
MSLMRNLRQIYGLGVQSFSMSAFLQSQEEIAPPTQTTIYRQPHHSVHCRKSSYSRSS